MIFGIGIGVVGYAVFYWGLHHFPNVDGGKRYSLITLLGFPSSWNLTPPGGYGQIGLTPGGSLTSELSAETQGSQAQQPENQTTPSGLTGGGSWISGILQGINAPTSQNNQHKLTAWNSCEGNLQGHSGLGINNPFNITADSYQPATKGTGAVNSAGVQSFPTLTAGITGTIAKLSEPFAGRIRANLVNDATFADFADAVGSSGWGTSGSCIAGQ